jgi:hypothetical protein
LLSISEAHDINQQVAKMAGQDVASSAGKGKKGAQKASIDFSKLQRLENPYQMERSELRGHIE